MTTISLYGGPLKRTIINRAYGYCGQSTTEFELTPEEYELGLQAMNQIAATIPTMPFNAPLNGTDGYPTDESGVLPGDVLGFQVRIAQEIGPNIGKTFTPNGPQASAASGLTARYTTVPFVQMNRQTIRGAGNRFWNGPRPFFTAPVSPDEPQQ